MYFLVFAFLGENGVIRIHDNLDSELVFRMLPVENGNAFSFDKNSEIPQVMEGVKRNHFYNGPFAFSNVLFSVFSPINAYLVNFIVIKVLAFIGCYLLISSYLDKGKSAKYYAPLIALSFTFLPFYTITGGGITTVPLLVYCILNIMNSRHIVVSYFVVIAFPFISFIAIGTLYNIVGIWLFLSVLFLTNHSGKYKVLKVAFVYTFITLLAEIHLVQVFLFNDGFISHRTEWNPNLSTYNLSELLKRLYEFFFKGKNLNYHYPSFSMIITMSFLYYLGVRSVNGSLQFSRTLKYTSGVILFMIFLYLASSYIGFNPLKEKFPILKLYSFNKISFYFFLIPYFLFAAVNRSFFSFSSPIIRTIAFGFLILNIVYVLNKDEEFKGNIKTILGNSNQLTFRKVFAENLFAEISKDMGCSDCRVGSLGIHPSVALFNGFKTIDGYVNIYDVNYKHRFRKIIAGELEKNDDKRIYFDEWGSRCYLFSSEDFPSPYIHSEFRFEQLLLDRQSLKEINCDFIFSAFEINNSSASGLQFVKQYTNLSSPLKVYLYKVF